MSKFGNFVNRLWPEIMATIVLLFLAISISLLVFDCGIAGEEQVARGEVYAKEFEPANTATTLYNNGKSLIPINSYDPERYLILFWFAKHSSYVSVDEITYNDAEIGDVIFVTYGMTRFSKSIIVVDVSFE